MTEEQCEQRRSVMRMAWAIFRWHIQQGQPRAFSECLAGAWKFSFRMAEFTAPLRHYKYIQFTSLIQSPIERAWGHRPVDEAAHAYLTAVLGR